MWHWLRHEVNKIMPWIWKFVYFCILILHYPFNNPFLLLLFFQSMQEHSICRPITKACEDVIVSSEVSHSSCIPVVPSRATTMVLPSSKLKPVITKSNTSQVSGSVSSARCQMRRSRASVDDDDTDIYQKESSGITCAFCRKNGETREFYTTHKLKVIRRNLEREVLRLKSKL